jgi:hypothetical protein
MFNGLFNRQKQPGAPLATGSPCAGQGTIDPKEEEFVRALLARGSTKSAVEQAKDIHKRYQSPASEALLVDAYGARIRSLLEHGLATEAGALLSLVCERYASAKEKLADIGIAVAGRQSRLDDLLKPLNDPAISESARAAIEDTIKRQVTDLSGLAQCAALPPSHPLRAGAQALQRAFEAVTSGPAGDSDLLLSDVPRRGPLAPWKMLVRAIAYFYQRDDSACERCLQTIDPGSAPARLVPAIRAMLSQEFGESLDPASARLARQVGGNMRMLRSALESLDAAFASKKGRARISPAIHEAISACRSASPEMLDRLRQHISVRAAILDMPVETIRGALGGSSVKDAYFWRLYARSAESAREPRTFAACSMWEEFRRHAVAEGWFAEEGPEAAALYLHIADLLRRIPHEELPELRGRYILQFKGYGDFYKDQSPSIRAVAAKCQRPDFYYLVPSQLFERACTMDPHREAFEQWVDWAETEAGRKEAERAAEAWRRALPNDSQPLLYLMEAAEKRGALTKAFRLLGDAEKIDSLNPEVRRAALRLLVGQAIRHLRQRKAHLAEQDLASLEPLPQAQEGDRPAFLAALRWLCCIIRGDAEAASNFFAKASGIMQSPAAALLTCTGTGEACGLGDNDFSPYLPFSASSGEKPASMASAVARACALGDDMGAPINIPAGWERGIFKELSNQGGGLEARELRALGEAALRRNRLELAYAASAAGLAKGGDAEGRFLLLRARALPGWEFGRRAQCIDAAAELGRRRRDMDLVDKAVELRRGRRRRRASFFDWIDHMHEEPLSLTTEGLNAILEREKQSTKFPVYKPAPFRKSYQDDPFPEDDWDEEEEDEEDFQEREAFGEAVRELQRILEGKGPKATPRKQRRRTMPQDFPDQGDFRF